MKNFSLVLIEFGLLGIAYTLIPIIIYNNLFFVDNEAVKFSLSIFTTLLITGCVIYIFIQIKDKV